MDKTPFTYYASPKRSSIKDINNLNEIFVSNEILCNVLNAVPDSILILNKDRQVIFANKTVISFINEDNFNTILGMRPGELLNCEHSPETEGGCGTSEFCKTCGAVNAILSSQKGFPDVQECRITQKGNLEALDLKIYTTPLSISGHDFTIFSIVDISHEKRRRMLEKIFLHDIINTAMSVNGAAHLLSDGHSDNVNYSEMIINLSNSLIEEIVAQREISSAETNELIIELSTFNSIDLLKEITRIYRIHEKGREKNIEIDPTSEFISINSDRLLLRRVLGNMIKNALEATKKDGVVNTGCYVNDGVINYWVQNDAFIPRDNQLQIFQRSFTTKGTGRGIGTYSIRLFTEKYLKGKATLTSSKEKGTIFTVSCPINLTV